MNTQTSTSSLVQIAMKEVVSDSPLPTRNNTTDERTFSAGEIEIINRRKNSIEDCQRTITTVNGQIQDCLNEHQLITETLETSKNANKASVTQNTSEQSLLQQQIAEEQKQMDFYKKYQGGSKKATTKKKWFKGNTKFFTIIAVLGSIELIMLAVTFYLQREVFSIDDIKTRLLCVVGIILVSVFTHRFFDQAERKDARWFIGSCLFVTMLMGILTIAHAVFFTFATVDDMASTFDFSFDSIMSEANAVETTSKSRMIQGFINNPGIAEILIAGLFAVLSLVCHIFTNKEKKDEELPLNTDNDENSLQFYIDSSAARIEELKGKLAIKETEMVALNQQTEDGNNNYKERVENLMQLTKQLDTTRIEALSRQGYLLDEEFKELMAYRGIFVKLYCEKNNLTTVDYDAVTRNDLLKYHNISC